MGQNDSQLIEAIDDWLPQVQCGRCGYPGCRPYAEAVARGEAAINQCPPGGETTINALAELLGVSALPLDPGLPATGPRVLARVTEEECIGCTLCLRACPVDAIVGASQQLHTVLVDACTGCGLCAPPCPTDCIRLLAHPTPGAGPWADYSREEVEQARERHRSHQRRVSLRKALGSARNLPLAGKGQIRTEIEAAVARVRARRKGSA